MSMKRLLSLVLASVLLFSIFSCSKIQSDLEVTDTEETTEAIVTTEAETEPPAGNTVTLYMVGDVLLHERVTESGLSDDGTYNFDHLFAHVKDDIESADIAIANQEVILGGEALGLSGYPNFNGPFEVGDALVDAGFDVVLHATNHALDRNGDGIMSCLGYWKTVHPSTAVLGIFETEEESREVYITNVNGINVAILNYTYGTNGIEPPYDMPFAVNYLDEDTLIRDLTYAEENADFTVVCPHWGTEYEHAPDDSQRYWADLMIENGADLIIGTHPHVIEPLEEINGVPVYWSLGNFINSTAEEGAGVADRMLGAAAKVTIKKNDGGDVTVKEYTAEPLVCHVADGTDMTTYRLGDYTEEMAAGNLIVYSDPAFSVSYLEDLFKNVMGN